MIITAIVTVMVLTIIIIITIMITITITNLHISEEKKSFGVHYQQWCC